MASRGTQVLGREAEDFAAKVLEERGFAILMRNVRLGHLEVDIVARQGAVVVVVEVRRRGLGAWTTALGSVDPEKRKRVRMAGDRLWRRYFKSDLTVERMRFDVVGVSEENGVLQAEHIPAAF